MTYRGPDAWLRNAHVADLGARLVPAHLLPRSIPRLPSQEEPPLVPTRADAAASSVSTAPDEAAFCFSGMRPLAESPGTRAAGAGVTVTLSPALAILVKAIAVHESLDESDLAGVIDHMAARVARDIGLGELARAVADHRDGARCRKASRGGGP